MISRFHALVLKSYETGNTSEVFHVLSADHGRLSVYARGIRSPKSRYRSVLQPLSLVELLVSMREGAEMATLREAALLNGHGELTTDLERLSLGLLLSEAAGAACATGQPAPELFAALLEALHELAPDSGHTAPEAACHGMLRLLASAGYAPQLAGQLLKPWPHDRPRPARFRLDLESATVWSPEAGDGFSPSTGPSLSLAPRAVRLIHRFAEQGDPGEIPAAEANELLVALVSLAEYQLETRLKSAEFWRQIAGVGSSLRP